MKPAAKQIKSINYINITSKSVKEFIFLTQACILKHKTQNREDHKKDQFILTFQDSENVNQKKVIFMNRVKLMKLKSGETISDGDNLVILAGTQS